MACLLIKRHNYDPYHNLKKVFCLQYFTEIFTKLSCRNLTETLNERFILLSDCELNKREY